jgi:hypothetical protein
LHHSAVSPKMKVRVGAGLMPGHTTSAQERNEGWEPN